MTYRSLRLLPLEMFPTEGDVQELALPQLDHVIDVGRGGASVGAVLIRDGSLYYAVAGNVRIAVLR